MNGQLCLVPGQTDSHLNPNNFEKMHVGTAAKIYSNKIAIKIYQEMPETPENKKIKDMFKGKIQNLL